MRTYSVPALEKAVAILELIARSGRDLSASEIYTALAIPKATAFMVLNSLERHAIVKKSRDNHYSIGVKLYELGNAYISNLDIVQVSRPHLVDLMRETGFAAHLAIVLDARVLFIDKVEPNTFTRFSTFPGMRADIHISSFGKAIAAYL